MINFKIRPLLLSDSTKLLDIINHYVYSTINFSDKTYDLTNINKLIDTKEESPKYLAEINTGEAIGFALAYPFRPEIAFASAIKFTYWIKPSFTGNGIGSTLYDFMENDCRIKGIKNILVNISSENSGSIKFHEKRGFDHCGKFTQIGNKFGKPFDLIWMQKIL